MNGGIERRLDRLSLVWSRPCPGCAALPAYVSVVPARLEELRRDAEAHGGDLPARRCPACGRRLEERTFTTIDVTRV